MTVLTNKKPTNNKPGVWQPRFIEALRELGHVGKACELAKVSKQTVYNYRRDDKEFEKAWDLAIEDAAWSLEDEAWRRGRDGVDKPIVYKGIITGTMKEYSDTLLMFMLKGIKPDKFADRFVIKVDPADMALLKAMGFETPAAAWQALMENARKELEVDQDSK